jgi:catechol 2,3-dioxygenase-like lactoylglutathione lyase family enzyme
MRNIGSRAALCVAAVLGALFATSSSAGAAGRGTTRERAANRFPTVLSAVQIPVADFARSAAFYEQLGMKVGVDYSPGERELTLGDPAQGSDILILEAASHPEMRPGMAALVFRVADLGAVVSRLRAAGFAAAEPRDAGPYLVVLVKDPDGNRVEIAQPTGRPTPW